MPTDLVDILRWHVDHLPAGRMRESDLLFPSDTGGFRAPSALDKPFRAVASELELTKTITLKAMRSPATPSSGETVRRGGKVVGRTPNVKTASQLQRANRP